MHGGCLRTPPYPLQPLGRAENFKGRTAGLSFVVTNSLPTIKYTKSHKKKKRVTLVRERKRREAGECRDKGCWTLTLGDGGGGVGGVRQLVGGQRGHASGREASWQKVVECCQLVGSCLLAPTGAAVTEPDLGEERQKMKQPGLVETQLESALRAIRL